MLGEVQTKNRGFVNIETIVKLAYMDRLNFDGLFGLDKTNNVSDEEMKERKKRTDEINEKEIEKLRYKQQ